MRLRRVLGLLGVWCSVSFATGPAAAVPVAVVTAADTAAAVGYEAPLSTLAVRRRFDIGIARYGPGHRGVDLAAAIGVAVRTAGPGVVSFAGQVAGRGVVVVLHPDGIRTTYEPVRPAVVTGAAVRSGAVVGVVDGQHDGCAGPCLHWGARRGEEYLDPLSLLRPLGPVRLLPWT